MGNETQLRPLTAEEWNKRFEITVGEEVYKVLEPFYVKPLKLSQPIDGLSKKLQQALAEIGCYPDSIEVLSVSELEKFLTEAPNQFDRNDFKENQMRLWDRSIGDKLYDRLSERTQKIMSRLIRFPCGCSEDQEIGKLLELRCFVFKDEGYSFVSRRQVPEQLKLPGLAHRLFILHQDKYMADNLGECLLYCANNNFEFNLYFRIACLIDGRKEDSLKLDPFLRIFLAGNYLIGMNSKKKFFVLVA